MNRWIIDKDRIIHQCRPCFGGKECLFSTGQVLVCFNLKMKKKKLFSGRQARAGSRHIKQVIKEEGRAPSVNTSIVAPPSVTLDDTEIKIFQQNLPSVVQSQSGLNRHILHIGDRFCPRCYQWLRFFFFFLWTLYGSKSSKMIQSGKCYINIRDFSFRML